MLVLSSSTKKTTSQHGHQAKMRFLNPLSPCLHSLKLFKLCNQERKREPEGSESRNSSKPVKTNESLAVFRLPSESHVQYSKEWDWEKYLEYLQVLLHSL